MYNFYMNIINVLLKILISIFLILFIIYLNLIASAEPAGANMIIIYHTISIFVILMIIYSLIRNIRIYVFLIILILWILFNRIPAVNQVFDKDMCLDFAMCREGLDVNTEYGLIKINEENCIKYNWEWNQESKMCNMH